MNTHPPFHRTSYFLAFLFVTLVLVSCASVPNEQRIDNFPMYRQPEVIRPEAFKKLDEEFIKKATKGFGNREEASKAWFVIGEEFFNEGNYHYAMRRFNQSWLLDLNNYLPYWGFGQVLLERDQFDEAIKHLKKAKELIGNSNDKPRLLSDIGSAYSYKVKNIQESQSQESSRFYDLSNQYFKESVSLDPAYAGAWLRWAFSLYWQNNYEESWKKIKKVRSIGGRRISDSFIKKLSQKMPEPK